MPGEPITCFLPSIHRPPPGAADGGTSTFCTRTLGGSLRLFVSVFTFTFPFCNSKSISCQIIEELKLDRQIDN